jgi:hypothetical protein
MLICIEAFYDGTMCAGSILSETDEERGTHQKVFNDGCALGQGREEKCAVG